MSPRFEETTDNHSTPPQTNKEKSKRKKMSELKQERYGLKETLKKLDETFNQGNLSEVDYFRTYKNLQKQIYSIDKKVNSLNNGTKVYD